MTDKEKKQRAKEFATDWSGKGYEKGETSRFWIDLLYRVYGIENAANYIEFEKQIKLESGGQGFIDGYIPSVKVLIEQKGSRVDLRKPEKQSDGSMLTPYQQSRRYENEMLKDEQPDWIILCNFAEFIVYDMRVDKKSPVLEFTLENLPKEVFQLDFLVDKNVRKVINEVDISIAAGKLVSELYDALLDQYDDKDDPENLRSLNILCVRLVFSFYAEDAGVFNGNNQFGRYLERFRSEPQTLRKMLIELFNTLDTPDKERDPYDDKELLKFPYVNGGLFDKSLHITVPPFNEKIVEIIIDKASSGFNWADISPTIFGAVFESTLNPETRRSGGMHYTSIDNIHKVIDPLFLDDLKNEFEDIKALKQVKTRNSRLVEFQNKLSSLKFLDPACGSGNFLTETYLSLRRLENEAIKLRQESQIEFETGGIIKVSIGQFYGIEINDFAVSVTKAALWIAESQMFRETEEIVRTNEEFLPLKSYANIVEGNALRVDWESVVSKSDIDYIMGNPPFVGYSLQSKQQKEDILSVYVDENNKPYKTAGKIDYVAGWYYKACKLMVDTDIRAALVSTNSITQGEQVSGVWKPLFDRFNAHIDFAYRTFRWDNEAYDKAHVHCVIVGFSVAENDKDKVIYDNDSSNVVNNINPYLIDGDNIFIENRNKPIGDVPEMIYGNKPTDGGFLFLSSEERKQTIAKEPSIEKYIRQIYGATEYINNQLRYCIWLVNASPADVRNSKFLSNRVSKVKEFRQNSPKEATRKSAETSTLFQEIRQPNSTYILIPRHSSETRRYIPFGFVEPQIIVNDAVQIIPNATLYHFGVLTSSVHMAWVRTVCGRLKSDYRYSKDIVYNNFPWCSPTDEQKAAIEQTAQAILDARALYPDSSLADLYDELTMPKELRTAHENNDKAVRAAYGFSAKMSEQEIVAKLMKMYEMLINSPKAIR